MFNLLSNAVKFTPAGGTITVSARVVTNEEVGTGNAEQGTLRLRSGQARSAGEDVEETEIGKTEGSSLPSAFHVPGSALEISVTDTGVGIAPEEQERIFEEFYQVANHAVGKAKGTGLGLALSVRFVTLHGGKLRVESGGVGKGSRFSFSVPVGGRNAEIGTRNAEA